MTLVTWAALAIVVAYIVIAGGNYRSPVPEPKIPLRTLWLAMVCGGLVGAFVGGTRAVVARHWAIAAGLGAAIALAAALVVLRGRSHLHLHTAGGIALAALTAVFIVLGVVITRRYGRLPRSVEILAFVVVVAMALTDLVILRSKAVRDFDLYLLAGRHFLDAAPVYLAAPMTQLPADPVNLPFLYPPLTLPFFAVLASMPHAIAVVAWEIACVVAVIAGLLLLGVRHRWIPLILLMPPFFQGLYVGNVVLFGFLLLCLGPVIGSSLALGPILKIQFGVLALWLLRERRWRDVAIGVAMLVALALVTLPWVGVDLWRQWLTGLESFRETQSLMPKTFYQALPRYVPYVAYLALSVIAVIVGLVTRGRAGLARLGAAAIVTSPTVFDHGFTFAIPALLALSAPALWLGLGLVSLQGGAGLWGAVLLAVVGGSVALLRHSAAGDESLHPLRSSREPWETASETGHNVPGLG